MAASDDLILLVEDDENDELLTTRTLRDQHVPNPVEVVRDGQAALDFLFARGAYAHRASELPPRLVLLDLKLPRRSGLEVIKVVRSDPRFKDVPIVVFSSSARKPDVDQAYANGASGYVAKPVDVKEFREALRSVVTFWLANRPRGS